MSDVKKGFDLADVLKNVSDLDTNSREQIEYIDIDLIDGDPLNFYEMSDIDALAENIELVGLQQPLRVRNNPDAPGHVTITSGHRRRAAIQKLVNDGREDLREIACIREQPATSTALQELRLIYANSDTRKMSPSDVSKQAARVEALLYQLKEEGYEFPGRMRDHVAQACQISKSKLARLKVIREKLASCWMPAFEQSALVESNAYALAQMPTEYQHAIWAYWIERGKEIKYLYESTIKTYSRCFAKIDKLKCNKCKGPCENKRGKQQKVLSGGYYPISCPEKCCSVCPDLAKCKLACPQLADQISKIKSDAKTKRQQEKLAQEAKDRPKIRKIQDLWERFGHARAVADVSLKDAFKTLGRGTNYIDEIGITQMENLEGKYTVDTKLPYEYSCRLEDIEKFVRLADLFKCSIDYLFCRTDNPGGFVQAPAAAATATDVQIRPAVWYSRNVEPPVGVGIVVMEKDGWAEGAIYVGGGCLDDGCTTRWCDVVSWTLSPNTSSEQLPVPTIGGWHPGVEDPAEPVDAVAIFSADGLAKPLRKIAHWNGRSWQFPGGATIEAKCIRWLPLPPEE